MSQDIFSDSQLFNSQDEDEDNGSDGDNSGDETVVNGSQASDPPLSQMSDTSLTNGHKKGFLKTDLSEDLKIKYKETFVDIALKTKEAESCSEITRSTEVLSKQMVRQDKCFRSGGVNENMPFDAKCILQNSAISLQLVKRLQTDSKQFDAMEFAEKLLTAIDPFHRLSAPDANESVDSRAAIDRNDWIDFSRKYCRFHRVLPPFVYIKGAFDSQPTDGEPKAAPKPRVRHAKPVISAQTEATQIDLKDKNSNEDTTPEEVEFILQTVQKLELKNKDIPCLPYIEVIANPKSMSETVENIFHSTFLIKDGLARLVAGKSGVPGIQTIDNAGIDVNAPENGIQSVFSFSMKDWKYWCEHFEITRPAIRHVKKSAATPKR